MNQCDGCKLGLPIEKGVHIFPEETGWNRLHMVCTKHLYVDRKDNLGNENKFNSVYFSEHSCGNKETKHN